MINKMQNFLKSLTVSDSIHSVNQLAMVVSIYHSLIHLSIDSIQFNISNSTAEKVIFPYHFSTSPLS
jgi:hypothetical protein